MAEFPALPLWTDAYLGDTVHLSTIEHGAYLLILICMWRTKEKRLPNDPKLLAKYAKLTNGQWQRIGPVLMPFFTVDGDWIYQGRLTDEALVVRQRSRQQSDKARSRWLKTKETDKPRLCPDDTPTPTPTPISNIDKKDTNVSFLSDDASDDTKNGAETDLLGMPPDHKSKKDREKAERRFRVSRAVELYNLMAAKAGLSEAQNVTKNETRMAAVDNRLNDLGGLSGWELLLEKVANSRWLTGENEQGWKADLDWISKPANTTRIMEGRYENRTGSQQNNRLNEAFDRVAARLRESRKHSGEREPD